MQRLPLVVGILLAAGVATWALLSRAPEAPGPDPVALEPLATTPLPPVALGPPPHTPPGLHGRPRAGEPPADRVTLVEERNRLARAHRDLVARFEAGAVSQTEVERAELDLLDARRRLGEIDEAELRRARIVLLEREAERATLRVDAGMVAAIEAERARLALLRERSLAGEAVDYPAKREAFLKALAERGARLREAGLTTEAAVREAQDAAEADFPP